MPTLPKILHVIHSGAFGGGPRVVLDLALRVEGDHTIAAGGDGVLLREASSHGIRTVVLPFAGEFSFAASLPLLYREFKRADLVHLHGQFAAFYSSFGCSLARTPTVYTAHFPSFVTDRSLLNRGRNHVAEAVPCVLSTMVVACSETMRQEYIARGLIRAERIVKIHNGVPFPSVTREPSATLASLKIHPDDSVVLALGRFTDQKGFDLLIEAIPGLLRSVPTAKVVLAGDGECRKRLEALVGSLNIEHAVRFAGYRSDTGDLLTIASLVVVPSRYDVFPLVPLEAMMAQRAVVATNLPVLQEAVEHEVTGLLVPPHPAELAEAMITLIRDPLRRQEMGRAGGVRARERFSVDRMVGDYRNLYRSLTVRADS